MKKLLIGLCAASLLAASAVGYAGTVTFVNKYDQAVTFVVSHGPVYNPVAGGTVGPGEQFTQTVSGPFDSNNYFMAFPPYSSNIVSNCGHPMMPMDNVTVKAGWSRWTGMFTCRIYPTEQYVQYQQTHKGCHRHHQEY